MIPLAIALEPLLAKLLEALLAADHPSAPVVAAALDHVRTILGGLLPTEPAEAEARAELARLGAK